VPTQSIIILRHRKENLKKCSLRGLEGRPDLLFFKYPQDVDTLPISSQTILLDVEGAELSPAEAASQPILLLDGTWRYAAAMKAAVQRRWSDNLIVRRLPHTTTAYPRYQTGCSDPGAGLASVEALYVVCYLGLKPTAGLLQNYHWRHEFLELNPYLNSLPSSANG